tara:strand:+ start:111 stop:497 length:387 start_codon:yes stop_codon:yes gene_type:complete
MYLCRELWREIWSYDLTYRKLFDTVMQEIKLRYDDGRWWVRQSGLLVLGSRKYILDINTNNSLIMIDENKLFDVNKNKKGKKNYSAWSARSYYELNFLTRDNDYSISQQFFRLQDVLREFKRKISVVS